MDKLKSLFPLLPFLVVAVLLSIRGLIYFHYYQGWEVYFYSDSAIYAALAKRLLSGDLLGAVHPYWNPGFPVATIPFYLLSGSWEKSHILVSMFSATALIGVMFLFLRKFSLTLGLITAFVITFSVSLERLVIVEGITEPLYMLMLWLAIFTGWVALCTKRWVYFALSGLFWGVAYLVRTEGFALLAAFLLVSLVCLYFQNRPYGIKKISVAIVTRLGVLVLVFILLNLPYIAGQSIHLEKFTFSGKYAFFGSGPPYAIEPDRYSTVAQDIWSIDFPNYHSPYYDPARTQSLFVKFLLNGTITQGFGVSFKESLLKYQSVGSVDFFVGLGLLFSLVGFVYSVLSSKFRLLTLYLTFLWLSGFIWVVLFMAPHYRYLIFALPFFFYLQSLGILFVSRAISKSITWPLPLGVKHVVKQGIFLIVLGLLLGDFFLKNVNFDALRGKQVASDRKNMKVIGDWLKSQRIQLVGGRMESIPFYADARLVYIPSAAPGLIVKYLKAWGVEYMVLRPDDAGYEVVRPITRSDFQHPDLSLVKTFEDGTVVWKIKLTEEEKRLNQRTILGVR